MAKNTGADPSLDVHTDQAEAKREYSSRRKPDEYRSVPHAGANVLLAQGWSEHRRFKTRIRLRRPRTDDELLENQVWCLLYNLGYREISRGRNFQVPIRRPGAEVLYKRVAVLARDEETVLVVECKSWETMGERSLEPDIAEFGSLKSPLSTVINRHYGSSVKPKIVWILVTNNIVWSEPDKNRAQEESIRRVTERELEYYEQLARHLGPAARFQILAEFLEGQKIPALADRKVPAIRGKLGGQVYYSFVTTPKDLLKIAFINHRTLNDPNALPAYQRLLTRSRVNRIEKYISSGGFFPTNLLLNLKAKPRFDIVKADRDTGVTYGYLYLPDEYKSAWVIDGQHRLYGYSRLAESFLGQNLLVVAFDRLATDQEAKLFVTINHEQKSVPRTLLDDLQGDLSWGSDVPRERLGALAARLIGQLDNDFGGPFYRRVVREGIRATTHTCLTIPALRLGLQQSRLLGEAGLRSHYAPGPLTGPTDDDTVERGRRFLSVFFGRIRRANPELWDRGRDGFLCTNVSVQGFLLLAASLIQHWGEVEGTEVRELSPEQLLEEMATYLSPIEEKLKAADEAWARRHLQVKYGSGGHRQYHYRLCRMVRERHTRFSPSGYDVWREEQSEERRDTAERQLKDIATEVHSVVFDMLRREYGDDKYFEDGIPTTQMKVGAYQRQQEDPRRLSLDSYLDFIDYRKVVETREHWPLFKEAFDIPEKGDRGRAKNSSGWSGSTSYVVFLRILRRSGALRLRTSPTWIGFMASCSAEPGDSALAVRASRGGSPHSSEPPPTDLPWPRRPLGGVSLFQPPTPFGTPLAAASPAPTRPSNESKCPPTSRP